MKHPNIMDNDKYNNIVLANKAQEYIYTLLSFQYYQQYYIQLFDTILDQIIRDTTFCNRRTTNCFSAASSTPRYDSGSS